LSRYVTIFVLVLHLLQNSSFIYVRPLFRFVFFYFALLLSYLKRNVVVVARLKHSEAHKCNLFLVVAKGGVRKLQRFIITNTKKHRKQRAVSSPETFSVFCGFLLSFSLSFFPVCEFFTFLSEYNKLKIIGDSQICKDGIMTEIKKREFRYVFKSNLRQKATIYI
jgi:hypothetical protein